MDLKEIKEYETKLFKFLKSEHLKLLKLGIIEVSKNRYYDYVAHETKPYYRKNGIYSNYQSKIQWRECYRLVNPNYKLSNYLQSELEKKEFYIDFVKNLPHYNDFNILSNLNKYNRYIFENYLKAEHKYNREFRKIAISNLQKVISKGSYFIVDSYLLNGVWTKKEINYKSEKFEFSILKPRINTWQALKEKHNLKPGFNSFFELSFFSKNSNLNFDPENIFILLSLYKLGGVFSDYNYNYRHYFAMMTSWGSTNNYNKARYTYEIRKNEEAKLQSFLDSFTSPLLSILEVPLSPTKKQKSKFLMAYGIKIAIDRYRDAMLLRNMTTEKIISTVIMGLEALYNHRDSETIGFKLRIRVALVLCNFGFNGLDVAKKVNEGYSIRSKYAHGAMSDKKISRDFEKDLLNFLRMSILIFLQIDKTKSDFIELMNYSMYSDSHKRTLRKYLKTIKPLLPRVKNQQKK